MVSALADACAGSQGVTTRIGCTAGTYAARTTGQLLLDGLLWLPHAFGALLRTAWQPGQPVGPVQVLAWLLFGTVLAVRWTLAHDGPLSSELRLAVRLGRAWTKRHPRAWLAVTCAGRGLVTAAAWAGWLLALVWPGRRGRLLRLLLLAGIGYLLVALFAFFVGVLPGPLPFLVVLGVLGWLGYQPTPQPAPWHNGRELAAAMVAAGILDRPRPGSLLPALPVAHVVTDPHGTRAQVRLPAGKVLADVEHGRERLEGALGLPVGSVRVTAAPSGPAGTVSVWVADPDAPAPEPDPPRTTAEQWGAPLTLGRSPQGQLVHFQTVGTHSLLAGRTGAGKTVAARRVAARAALDPDVRLYLLDGKGSGADWGALVPLCAAAVPRMTGEDLPGRVTGLLASLVELARSRDAIRRRTAWAPVVLLVEEWAAVRSALGRAAGEADALMKTLLGTGRSSGIHVVLITQKPTSGSVPTEQKANVAQRLVLQCADREGYGHALGTEPTGPLPRNVGDALLTNDAGSEQQPVHVENLTDDEWEALCTAAAELRGIVLTEDDEVTLDEQDEVTFDKPAEPTPEPLRLVKAPPVDPLHAAVVAVLRDSSPAGVPASELLALLPEHLRPSTPAVLGKRLSSCLDVAQTRDGSTGRRWRLADTVPSPRAQDSTRAALQGGDGAVPTPPALLSPLLPWPPLRLPSRVELDA